MNDEVEWDEDYWFARMEEYFADNPVAKLVKEGKNVLVLCLKGDNSDYVRMNGMPWPNKGFAYGLAFHYGSTDEAAGARYNLFLSVLAQHRSDAIAFQVGYGTSKEKLAVFELASGELPTMDDLLSGREKKE